MDKQHWAKQKECGSNLGIRFLLGFYRLGGKWLVKLSLLPVLAYFFLRGKSARHASLDFLRRVYVFSGRSPTLAGYPGLRMSFRHFRQFANAALDKVDVWVGKLTLQNLQIEEMEDFARNMEQGRGALLIASHLGNVEVCRALVKERLSTRMNVLVFTTHAERFNRILKELNSEVDVNLIQASGITPDMVIMLRERIDQGECVVVVGDRIAVDAPDNVVWVDFLGQSAPFAIGPWVLASVLECSVYLIFCMQEKRHYRLEISPFAARLRVPRKERRLILQSIVQDYARQLEQKAVHYPLQWYNFYDFWCLPGTEKRRNNEGERSDN